MLTGNAIGNLGNDAELKYSQSGAPVLRFNVATNGRVRNADGNWEDRTEWVRVMMFGQRAETLAQYLKKGMRVYVAGRLEARPWTTKVGDIRAGLELIADLCEFMSARNEDGGQQQQARPAQRGSSDDGDLDSIPF